jgi:hypothetical protein
MASLGRYGAPGAFLVPLYGASELPQAFCRTAVRFDASRAAAPLSRAHRTCRR